MALPSEYRVEADQEVMSSLYTEFDVSLAGVRAHVNKGKEGQCDGSDSPLAVKADGLTLISGSCMVERERENGLPQEAL